MPIPFGRAFLALKGVFVFGWAFPQLFGLSICLFPCVEHSFRNWHRLLWWLWQVGVFLGVVSVLCGQGEGLPLLRFASWVNPLLILVLLGITMLLAGGGYRKKDRLSGVALLPVVSCLMMFFCGLVLLLVNGGVGSMGMLLVASLTNMVPLGAVAICLTALLKLCNGGNPLVKRLGFILLGIATIFLIPFAGFSTVISWPLPWDLLQLGLWTSFSAICVLLVVCGIGFYGIFTKPVNPDESVQKRFLDHVGLVVITLWLIWKFINPLTSYGVSHAQFSIAQWYATDIFLLITCGVVGMAVYVNRVKWFVPWRSFLWVFSCLFPLLTCGVALYVYAKVEHGNSGQLPMMMSQSAGFVSGFEAVAWVVLLVAAVVWFWVCQTSLDPEKEEVVECGNCFSWKFPVGVLLFAGLFCGTVIRNGFYLNEHARRVIPFESARPGKSAQGSAIYAAEGCFICHTQIVRRQLSGHDLQIQINQGLQGDTVYRVSEPQDYDPEMNEGAIQIGHARIGPDLFNLAARVDEYVSYRNADGEKLRAAAPDEWLMLHLYNPRAAVLGRPWSICPSMSFLFEKRKIKGARPDPTALPVKTEEGYEIVPTRRAVELVDYLKTLKRAGMMAGHGREYRYLRVPWTHITKEYARDTPDIDETPIAAARSAIVMEKGKQIFLSKCSICHGANGKGDMINYPPLDGSEWIAVKEPEVLAGIIRNGLTGPIEVNGKEWDSTMLPPGVVNAGELAPLMTYLLREFGKKQGITITVEQAEALWKSAEEKPE